MANLIKDVSVNKGYLRGTKAWAVNAAAGPQFGWMIDLANVISSTPYVQHDVFPFVLQYPKAFDLYPKDIRDTLVRTLKTLIETASRTIDGLRKTLATEWISVSVGGAGEVFEEISNVTRERSSPTHTWHELEGTPIGLFWAWIIENLLMSADSKYPNIVSENFNITTLLMDMTRFVTCYVEPDRTGQFCVDAYLCANMAPKSAGERTSIRDITSAKQGRDITVEFTAITQHGYGVIALGQKLLDTINFAGANPQYQPAAVDFVDANILAAKGGTRDQIETMGSQAISK